MPKPMKTNDNNFLELTMNIFVIVFRVRKKKFCFFFLIQYPDGSFIPFAISYPLFSSITKKEQFNQKFERNLYFTHSFSSIQTKQKKTPRFVYFQNDELFVNCLSFFFPTIILSTTFSVCMFVYGVWFPSINLWNRFIFIGHKTAGKL